MQTVSVHPEKMKAFIRTRYIVIVQEMLASRARLQTFQRLCAIYLA